MLQMNNLDLQTYLETKLLKIRLWKFKRDTNNDTLPSIQEDSEAEAFNGATSDTGLRQSHTGWHGYGGRQNTSDC